jgi:hypothetical protein
MTAIPRVIEERSTDVVNGSKSKSFASLDRGLFRKTVVRQGESKGVKKRNGHSRSK